MRSRFHRRSESCSRFLAAIQLQSSSLSSSPGNHSFVMMTVDQKSRSTARDNLISALAPRH